MIFTSSNFGAVRIKGSTGQKLKTSALSVSLRLCVKNLLAAALLAFAPVSAFAADVTVQVTAGQEAFGKVSGGKANAKKGATLTLKATPAKGYGFAGWYEGDTRVSWLSTWKYTVTDVDRVFTARFLSAKSGGLYVSNYKPNGYTLNLGETPKASDCFGVTYPNDTNPSEATVRVSGLPSGIKATADPDPKKNGGVVFTGSTKKAGVYYVTVSAKDSCGFAHSIVQKWIVGGADPKDGDVEGFTWPSYDSLSMSTWDGHKNTMGTTGLKKLSVSGLPAGLKFSSQSVDGQLKNEISGYPSKPGKYTISVSATQLDNAVLKARRTFIVADSGSCYVSVEPASSCVGFGTTTGSGVYKIGAKVPLSAKPAKGYSFVGWFTDSACTKPLVCDDNRTKNLLDYFTASGDYRKASDSMILYTDAASKAGTVYAKFIPKESDSVTVVLLGGSGYRIEKKLATQMWLVIDPFRPADGYIYVPYKVTSGTIPTVSAKGLPAGFKLDTKESQIVVDLSKVKPGMIYENVQLSAKNQSGNTGVYAFFVQTGHYKTSLAPNLKTATDAYKAMVGEDMEWVEWRNDLHLDDGYGDWKMSVTGLPPGIKANYYGPDRKFWLSGMPSKTGVYTPIVTFTRGSGTNKQTEAFSFTITVYEQNPVLVGTFNGVTSWNSAGTDIRPGARLVTITSANGGKVTAKVGNLSFSGGGWIHSSAGAWMTELKTGKIKEGGKTWVYKMTSYWMEADDENELLGELDRWSVEDEAYDDLEGTDRRVLAKQNCYGKGEWPDVKAAELAAMKTMYFQFHGAAQFDTWDSLVNTTDTKAWVKVTVDKKGVLKLSGKLGGKTRSGSTTLFPDPDGSLMGYLPISYERSCGEANWIFRFTYKNGVPNLEVKNDDGGACD